MKMIKGIKDEDQPGGKSKQCKGSGEKPFQKAGKDAVFFVPYVHVPS